MESGLASHSVAYPVDAEDELSTGPSTVTASPSPSPTPSEDRACRVICTLVSGRPLPFLGADQTVVGSVPYLPLPGRMLRIYSAAGVCLLQSSRIRLLMHRPDATIVVTKNSTYRVTFVDES
jgi:hypothetical protein